MLINFDFLVKNSERIKNLPVTIYQNVHCSSQKYSRLLYFWLKLFQYFIGYVFVVSISWLLNAINCNLFVRVPRSNYQTLMKVTFLFWFCYNDESIVLETAVLSDDWGQSLCGWMDIECSNSSVSTTISGDRAASGAARNATMWQNLF